MYPVSARFLAEVARSHAAFARVEVVTPSGVSVPVEFVAGEVTIDRTRDVRRTIELDLADLSLVPDVPSDLLAPYGNELRAWRGVAFVNGQVEEVPLGRFRITSVDVADGEDGVVVSVAGSDRSIVVARNRWIDAYRIGAGTDVATAIAGLLTNRFPGVDTSALVPVGATTPLAVLEAGAESDPWSDARALATSAGYELAFDADGVPRLFPPPDPSGTPALTLTEGFDAVTLEVARSLSTEEGVYNGVVATGEGSGVAAPVRGEAWDEDPASPTYRFGPFGQVPYFYSSPLITTAGQANAAAASLLTSVLGSTEQIEWGQVANPALDAGDLVELDRARAGLASVRLVIDSVTIPLTVDEPMQATGRRRFA